MERSPEGGAAPPGASPDAGRLLYAEDFEPGRVFELGSWDVTREDIIAFGSAWDPLTLHTDEAAAARTDFGGLIASGLHTIAIAIRLSVDAVVSRSAVVAGREVRSARLLAPVRPGMRLHGRATVLERRLRDDGRGVVVYELALRDEHSGPVLTLAVDWLVERRRAAEGDIFATNRLVGDSLRTEACERST